MEKVSILLRIPAAELQAITEVAKRQGRVRTEVIREAIREYVKREKAAGRGEAEGGTEG